MPRNPRKKLQKFLATRRHKHPHKTAMAKESSLVWFDILCACVPAFVVAGLYGALYSLRLFSVLYWPLHICGFLVLAAWVVFAFRGTKSFWTVKRDYAFASLAILLFTLGACWGGLGAPAVKVWISAPPYARQSVLQLGDPSKQMVYDVLEGSLIHISWTGQDSPPLVRFMGKEETAEASFEDGDMATTIEVPLAGKSTVQELVLRRYLRRLAAWRLRIVPDDLPKVSLSEEPEVTGRKTIRFAYKASDDFGIEQVGVRIAPTSSTTGVRTEPVELVLASPSVQKFETASYADLTSLPWVGVTVTAQLFVTDGAGRRGWSEPRILTLPARNFHNPFARALIEERQKFLAQQDRGAKDEAANVMAGIARQQSLSKGDPVVVMALRAGAVRLVLGDSDDTMAAVSDIMWKCALRLEEGRLGQTRTVLADAERDLSFALLRGASAENVRPYLAFVRDAMNKYFDALEAERIRQPPALQDMDWPIATASEMITPDDIQSRLTSVSEMISSGDRAGARATLSQLQSLIENLRSSPPELTPEQAQIVQNVSGVKSIARGQKSLIAEVERLDEGKPLDAKEKKAKKDSLVRALTQQQLLLSALKDVTGRQGVTATELKQCETIMQRAITALQRQDIADARKSQEDALRLLQQTVTALTETMRRSMTAHAP